jgi:hypothetical protein
MAIGVMPVAFQDNPLRAFDGDGKLAGYVIRCTLEHRPDKQALIREVVRQQLGKGGGRRFGVTASDQFENQARLAYCIQNLVLVISGYARRQIARQNEPDFGLNTDMSAVGQHRTGRHAVDGGRIDRRRRHIWTRHGAFPTPNRIVEQHANAPLDFERLFEVGRTAGFRQSDTRGSCFSRGD